jgi:hypothetical protein
MVLRLHNARAFVSLRKFYRPIPAAAGAENRAARKHGHNTRAVEAHMTKMIAKTMTLTVGSALAAAFLLAAGASADTRSAAYCDALVQKYDRYLASGTTKNRPPAGLETRQAAEACKAGDPAGIAALEKALENARIPLPPRG